MLKESKESYAKKLAKAKKRLGTHLVTDKNSTFKVPQDGMTVLDRFRVRQMSDRSVPAEATPKLQEGQEPQVVRLVKRGRNK